MRRDRFIDFFYVAPHQQEMHKRLENWAHSCYSGEGGSTTPMFRLYRADNYERESSGVSIDHHDAHKIAKGVSMLPIMHRQALNWDYLIEGSPMKIRRQLGVTMEVLGNLIVDGRQMLINRGV